MNTIREHGLNLQVTPSVTRPEEKKPKLVDVVVSPEEKAEMEACAKAIYEAFCLNVASGIARPVVVEELPEATRFTLEEQIPFFANKANNDTAWRNEIFSVQNNQEALNDLKEKNELFADAHPKELINTLWSCADAAALKFSTFLRSMGFPVTKEVEDVVNVTAKAYMRSISQEIQDKINGISDKGLSYLASKYEEIHAPKPISTKRVEVEAPLSLEQQQKVAELKAAIRKEISQEVVQGNNVNQSTISGITGCFMQGAQFLAFAPKDPMFLPMIKGQVTNMLKPALEQMNNLNDYSKTADPLSTRKLYNELSDLVYQDIRNDMQEIEVSRIAHNLANGQSNEGLLSEGCRELFASLQGYANTESLLQKSDWEFTPETILKTVAMLRVREKIEQYVERQNKALSEESKEKAA